MTIIRLDHPRLVKMIEAFQGEREIVVVMEHLAGDPYDYYDFGKFWKVLNIHSGFFRVLR